MRLPPVSSRKRVVQARGDLLGRQQPDPRRRQLERQRDAVEPRGRSAATAAAFRSVEREARLRGRGALDEEARRLGPGQRRRPPAGRPPGRGSGQRRARARRSRRRCPAARGWWPACARRGRRAAARRRARRRRRAGARSCPAPAAAACRRSQADERLDERRGRAARAGRARAATACGDAAPGRPAAPARPARRRRDSPSGRRSRRRQRQPRLADPARAGQRQQSRRRAAVPRPRRSSRSRPTKLVKARGKRGDDAGNARPLSSSRRAEPSTGAILPYRPPTWLGLPIRPRDLKPQQMVRTVDVSSGAAS